MAKKTRRITGAAGDATPAKSPSRAGVVAGRDSVEADVPSRRQPTSSDDIHGWMKQPKPNETNGHKAIRWHHGLAQITGGLSVCITKQGFKVGEIVKWIEGLRTIADQMEEMLNNAPSSKTNNPPSDSGGGGIRSVVHEGDEADRKGTKRKAAKRPAKAKTKSSRGK